MKEVDQMWKKEEINQLYNAVEHRKSVRKYTGEPLSDPAINEAVAALGKVRLIFPETSVGAEILNEDLVKGKFTNPGASYLAVYAKRDPKSYANAGAILEQMHLWFAANGIGSWIHGLASPVKPYDTKDGLPFAFILTFGNAAEPVIRNSLNEFTRNDVESFSDIQGIDDYLQAMRLAPSARNRQPWYLKGSADEMQFFTIKDNKLIAAIMPDLWVIDGGIAMVHLWLEAENQGKEIVFSYDETVQPASAKETYGCTITFK